MFLRRTSKPYIRANSSSERILRLFASIGVFMITGWLFWIQTGKNMEAIQARGMAYDQTDTLTKDQRLILKEMGAFLKNDFGQSLKIQVTLEPLVAPDLDNKTIFIGLCPSARQVVVELPPLVRSRLGTDFILDFQTTRFTPYFDSGDWPTGLLESVKSIIQGLTGIDDSSLQQGAQPINTGEESNVF